MPRVAGDDPGTVSFDLCVLDDGEPVVEQVFATGPLSRDSGPLLEALARHGPYELVYGPSGYGLPLVGAADVGARELAEMVLVRADEAHADTGVGGMRSLLRALAQSGLPVVFGRLARLPELIATLASSLGDIAPVIALVPGRASAAAHGGALLADALAGGRSAALAEALRLREASGTALDHLRMSGAETISLG